MARFTYKAIPAGGGKGGVISGQLDAADEDALRSTLRKQGLVPIEVRIGRGLEQLGAVFSRDRLRPADVAWFFQTLHRLVAARLPIEEAMATIADLAPKPRIAKAARELRDALRSGGSLPDAMEQVPGLGDAESRALLRVGMDSGRLDHALALIDRSMETRQRVRRTITSRLTYPAILLCAAVAAVWFLSSFVVPRFAETLASVGAELPTSTRITLALSDWMLWIMPCLIVGVGGLITLRPWRRSPRLQRLIDERLLKTPVVGSLAWHSQSVLVTDTLATVIEGGGEVLTGLEHAAHAVRSPTLRGRLDAARRSVREGVDLGDALAREHVLPPMSEAFVRVGMRSGNLVESLRWATSVSLEQQERMTSRLLTLLEPATILLLSGVVGWVVYSLVSGMLAVNELGGL